MYLFGWSRLMAVVIRRDVVDLGDVAALRERHVARDELDVRHVRDMVDVSFEPQSVQGSVRQALTGEVEHRQLERLVGAGEDGLLFELKLLIGSFASTQRDQDDPVFERC